MLIKRDIYETRIRIEELHSDLVHLHFLLFGRIAEPKILLLVAYELFNIEMTTRPEYFLSAACLDVRVPSSRSFNHLLSTIMQNRRSGF